MDLVKRITGTVKSVNVLPFQEEGSTSRDPSMRPQKVTLTIESEGQDQTVNALLDLRGIENGLVGQKVTYSHEPKPIPGEGTLHEFRLKVYATRRNILNRVYLE